MGRVGWLLTWLFVGMSELMSATGCSFIFVTPPPDDPSRSQASDGEASPPPATIDCTSSVLAPILDTAVAGYQLFRTGYALQADRSQYVNSPISRDADIAFGVGLSGLFIASTIYGFVNTSACSRIKESRLGVSADGDAVREPTAASFDPSRQPESPERRSTPQEAQTRSPAGPLPKPQLRITREPLPPAEAPARSEPPEPEPIEPSSPENPFNPF